MTAGTDVDARKLFALKVWQYKMGEVVSLMIHLGDRLGLYQSMFSLSKQDTFSSSDLASETGLNHRLLSEWLLSQAAAGLVDRHGADRYRFTDIQAAVLADEQGSLEFAGGAFEGGWDTKTLAALADSFRTGRGITYEEQGESAALGQARTSGPRQRLELEGVLAEVGLESRVSDGVRIAEIGCGAGVGLIELAGRFPNSTFAGFDPSGTAIGIGRAAAAERGLTNVSFTEAFASDLPIGQFDLVFAFDCLHDMPRPDLALTAAYAALGDAGTVFIKEMRSSGDFESDSRNPLLAMFYGFSVSSCLQSALSEPDGLGLGTLGLHPDRMTELLTGAGFADVTMYDSGDPAHLYYLAGL